MAISPQVDTSSPQAPALPERMLAALRCVGCGQGSLSRAAGQGLLCRQCGKVYACPQGIPDLAPSQGLPLPRLYQDPDYLRWDQLRHQAQDYFYREGSLVAWVQNAGHRQVRALRRGRRLGLTLDLGCGDGAHYPYLDNPAGCLGLDLDLSSLAKLRGRHPDFFVVRGDAHQLPLKDGAVDCIVNVYNLEHMVFLDHALEEMARVLAPGGDVFISVPSEGGLAWALGRRLTTARHFNAQDMDYMRVVQIEHVNCIWQLDRALRRHFRLRRRCFFPLGAPLFHLNLVVTYHCQAKTPARAGGVR